MHYYVIDDLTGERCSAWFAERLTAFCYLVKLQTQGDESRVGYSIGEKAEAEAEAPAFA